MKAGVSNVPIGRVKWYDAAKGFGYIAQEGGEDVYVRADALPEGVDTLKSGQRVDFSMVSGRRGPQALTVAVLETPSVRRGGGRRREQSQRRSPDELHGMIEDMITLLDRGVQPGLRKGRYPDRKAAAQIAEVMRAVARELDS